MNRTNRLATFVLLPATLIASLISPIAHAAPKTVTLGFQGPLTGSDAAIGSGMLSAAQFAVSEFNSRHSDVQVTLQTIDDLGSPSSAGPASVAAAANSNLIGVVGPIYTGAAIASFPAYRNAGIPLISPSASRDTLTIPSSIDNGLPVFHRVIPNYLEDGGSIAETAIESTPSAQSSSLISIVGDLSSSSDQMTSKASAEFDKVGVGYFKHVAPFGTTNYAAVSNTILSNSPKTVICMADVSGCGLLLKALRLANFVGLYVANTNVIEPTYKSFITSAGSAAAAGSIVVSNAPAPLALVAPAVSKRYVRSTGLQPSIYATETIDATNIFLAGIERGATTRAQLTKFIGSYSGTSLSGTPISFNSNGDLDLPLLAKFVVSNGSLTYAGTALPTISDLSVLVTQANSLMDTTDALAAQASSLLSAANGLLANPNKTSIDSNILLVQTAQENFAASAARARNLQIALSYLGRLRLSPVMVDYATATRMALDQVSRLASTITPNLNSAMTTLNAARAKLRR